MKALRDSISTHNNGINRKSIILYILTTECSHNTKLQEFSTQEEIKTKRLRTTKTYFRRRGNGSDGVHKYKHSLIGIFMRQDKLPIEVLEFLTM